LTNTGNIFTAAEHYPAPGRTDLAGFDSIFNKNLLNMLRETLASGFMIHPRAVKKGVLTVNTESR
jgi:hypothetical protein